MTSSKVFVPTSHPRYFSLMIREKLVKGFRNGLVAPEGLIAHGRGESFDYLLGERTTKPALKSIEAASALFLLADFPVLSVNGNTAALSAKEICELNYALEKSFTEVNLFYLTERREELIANELKKYGLKKILGVGAKRFTEIPELESNRRKVDPEGIFIADLVFVPLEDGDRTIALKRMGKKVITVDLNPLSRTSITADVSIVDNVVRVVPELIKHIEHLKKNSTKKELQEIVGCYDNKKSLQEGLDIMRSSKVLTATESE
ncbi:MAG: phosphopantothenate/pantothenate synthetase [Nitrosopumilus sp.]|nr:phosphopantothenate/pantothenate synthetase [Nitrosopumilus sp.]